MSAASARKRTSRSSQRSAKFWRSSILHPGTPHSEIHNPQSAHTGGTLSRKRQPGTQSSALSTQALPRPHHLRCRPAGARPEVRHQLRQDQAGTGLEAAPPVRGRLAADGLLVLEKLRMGERRQERRIFEVDRKKLQYQDVNRRGNIYREGAKDAKKSFICVFLWIKACASR